MSDDAVKRAQEAAAAAAAEAEALQQQAREAIRKAEEAAALARAAAEAQAAPPATESPAGPLSADEIATIRAGYAFDENFAPAIG